MSRYTDIDALLTSLGEGATVEQVEYALRDHITREVLAVLADRAAAGGGGSSGGLEAVGPFEIIYTDPDIATDPGPLLFSLTEGQWILDVWFKLHTEFNNGTATSVGMCIVSSGPNPTYLPSLTWDVLSGGTEDVTNDDLSTAPGSTGGNNGLKRTGQLAAFAQARSFPTQALVACDIHAVLFPDTVEPLNQGRAEMYALLWTP